MDRENGLMCCGEFLESEDGVNGSIFKALENFNTEPRKKYLTKCVICGKITETKTANEGICYSCREC